MVVFHILISYWDSGLFFGFLTPEKGIDRLSPNVGKELPLILVGDQLDAQFLFIMCLFESSTCFEPLCAHPQEDICINPLNPELNPIRYLLALLGAHHFLHVSRIRVKLLNFRLLMSYIYTEHPFLMFLDHTQRRSTVGRTPLDE